MQPLQTRISSHTSLSQTSPISEVTSSISRNSSANLILSMQCIFTHLCISCRVLQSALFLLMAWVWVGQVLEFIRNTCRTRDLNCHDSKSPSLEFWREYLQFCILLTLVLGLRDWGVQLDGRNDAVLATPRDASKRVVSRFERPHR
jgi:hypothetical protein